MIVLPLFLQMVLGYNAMEAGLSIAPLSLSMFAVAMSPGSAPATGARAASSGGLRAAAHRSGRAHPVRAAGGLRAGAGVPLVIAGSGLGLLVSQLNNYTLAPISEERISEAAGVNSAAGSFGLSFGLALAGAVMLATLAVRVHQMAETARSSAGRQRRSRPPSRRTPQLMSDAQLEELLAGQPADVQAEIIRINDERATSPCRSPCSSRCSRRPRPAHLVPNDAAARRGSVGSGGGDGPRLTRAARPLSPTHRPSRHPRLAR